MKMKRKIVIKDRILSIFKYVKFIIKSNDGKLYLDVFVLKSDLGKFKKILNDQEENIDNEYRKILLDRFSHGTKLAKTIYINYVKNSSVGSLDYLDVPYYNTNDGKVYLNSVMDSSNPRGYGVSWFHEHGHYIDAILGYASNDDNYRELLEQDAFEYRLKYGRVNHLKSFEQIDFFISRELTDMHLHSAVSDLMEALTNGNVSGLSGHGMCYWTKDKTNITSEAFPNALKYFEMILRMNKGGF